MSFGIAEGKLAARLAGPLHKPSGITIVPPQHAARFLLGTPILKVPLLRSVHALFLEGSCFLFTGSALLSNTPRGYCCFSPVVPLARQKSIHVQYVTALQACMPFTYTLHTMVNCLCMLVYRCNLCVSRNTFVFLTDALSWSTHVHCMY